MSRLEKVINAVKEIDATDSAWIFKDGKIRDDAICGDVLPWLEALREKEINVSDEFIGDFKRKSSQMYTYNHNCNISHDVCIWYKDLSPVAIVNVHLYGDARIVFDTDFAVKMDGDAYTCLLEMESTTQSKSIGDRYVADINIFSETYDVFDMENIEYVGSYYETDAKNLLAEIKEGR